MATQALAYLVEGGPANLGQLANFLSDTVLLTGEGFEPPVSTPVYGVHGERQHEDGRPTVGIVFYRAHALAGNTAFVDTLADAVEAAGANVLPVFCGSLARLAGDESAGLLEVLSHCDAVVATVLAAGGAVAADASAGRRRGCLGRGRLGGAGHPGAAGALPHVVPGDVAGVGRGGCHRWTRRCRWRSRSSTAG
ncbi:cobaltochelatase subunit CobN [Kutzneria kofuensis]|uniref:cobaltochelatase subunit CobN n=1 Tax=Kutzneria kofuensis TaxID=103725 RepID=UPI0031F03630